jgi:hypothetical protein
MPRTYYHLKHRKNPKQSVPKPMGMSKALKIDMENRTSLAAIFHITEKDWKEILNENL